MKVVFSDGEENEIGMDDPSDPPGSGHPGSGIGSGRRCIDPRKPVHLKSGDHPDSDSSSGKAVSIFEESALRFWETAGDDLLCSVTVCLSVYLLLYLSEYHLLQLVSVCLFLYLSYCLSFFHSFCLSLYTMFTYYGLSPSVCLSVSLSLFLSLSEYHLLQLVSVC